MTDEERYFVACEQLLLSPRKRYPCFYCGGSGLVPGVAGGSIVISEETGDALKRFLRTCVGIQATPEIKRYIEDQCNHILITSGYSLIGATITFEESQAYLNFSWLRCPICSNHPTDSYFYLEELKDFLGQKSSEEE